MTRIDVRRWTSADVAACATLVAARQRRDRARLRILPSRYEDADECARLLAALQTPRSDGAVAEVGGRVVGFLVGERELHSPRSFLSYFIEPYSVGIPLHGQAVAPEGDVVAVTRALYGALAAEWVARGFFTHLARVPVGDPDLQEAWVSLGFGRKVVCAIRPTGSIPARREMGIEMRQASPEDLDVVMRLVHVNAVHHAQPPNFWPMLPETVDEMRGFVAGLLGDPANAHLVAYRAGRPIGMQTFMAPTFLSPVLVPEHTIYLFHGVVEAEARAGGIGSTLLEHSMAWARAQGHAYCALHFGSANLSAAEFWPRRGFEPIEHTLLRHVDERIAWSGACD